MASKFRVEELRSKLSLLGIDTSGTKPVLVKRLEEAMLIEAEKEKATGVDESGPSSEKAGAGEAAPPPSDDVSNDCGNRSSVERDLKVDELRSMLSLRGLDTGGTKAIIGEDVSEKEVAVHEAVRSSDKAGGLEVTSPSDDVLNDNGKRKRSSSEPDDGGSKEVEEYIYIGKEKLNKYPVRELKALALQFGYSVRGTKRELVSLLQFVARIPKEKEPETLDNTFKGGAPVDESLPDDIKMGYHILQKGEDIYDATLNQTNVGKNNNKFYVIQALESNIGLKFMVYCRWGRVGVKGKDNLLVSLTEEEAIYEFVKIFRQKTNNDWINRNFFVSCPNYYTWLEMDRVKDGQEQMPSETIKSVDGRIQETKLDVRVAKFISLICDISMMKQQMLELGYNDKKLPLGKLSQSTILKGYDVLSKISNVIEQGDRSMLEQLSGEFYTVIPHDFGFKKMRDFVIDTPFKLKVKLEMVAALGEIEIAAKILQEDINYVGDPLYYHYQNLCCELTPVQVDSKEFSMVEKYIKNTHAETHSSYTVDLVHLFSVSRKGEEERFKQFSNVKNRMLLWHGSRLSNWTGILSQGLRIAPPEAPVNGYMFGKGVYFADMFSKSANYCCATSSSPTGVLLLCEVALGNMCELFRSNYKANILPKGKLSTKGVGATAPDLSEAEKLEDGVVVPLGKPKENKNRKVDLLYNEYIVYNVEQIRMRYIVQVNFVDI